MTRFRQRRSTAGMCAQVAPTLCLVALLGLPLAARQLPPGLLERAEQGDAGAQTELGTCYYAGRGVDRDDAEAVRWIRRAAEQEHAPAEYNLGLLYFRSRGVRGDDVEAAAWYRRAAEQGYAPAQGGLGYMYAYGAGVEEDRVRAFMWLELAWVGAETIADSRDPRSPHACGLLRPSEYELYDLETYPDEMNNLLGDIRLETQALAIDRQITARADPAVATLFANLSRRLDEILAETGALDEPTWLGTAVR